MLKLKPALRRVNIIKVLGIRLWFHTPALENPISSSQALANSSAASANCCLPCEAGASDGTWEEERPSICVACQGFGILGEKTIMISLYVFYDVFFFNDNVV